MSAHTPFPEELLVTKIGSEEAGFEYIVLTNHLYAKLVLGLPDVGAVGEKLLARETRHHLPYFEEFMLSSHMDAGHVSVIWMDLVRLLGDQKPNETPRGPLAKPLPKAVLLKEIAKLPKGVLKHVFSTEEGVAMYGAPLTVVVNSGATAVDLFPEDRFKFVLTPKAALFFVSNKLVAYLEPARGVGYEYDTGLKLLNTFSAELGNAGQGGGPIWYGGEPA